MATLPQTLKAPAQLTKDNENLYMLYYLKGASPHTQIALFAHAAEDFRAVTSAARRYCEQRSARFVRVQRALIDINDIESEVGI